MSEQNYEEYWKLTLEYTDFNDENFFLTLKMVVDKIDELNQNGIYVYNPGDNKELQLAILSKLPKSSDNLNNQLGSTRKAINQCIKLGFVNPGYQSYHPNTREYLEAKTIRKRKTIFSKIVYSNAKFNSSVTTFHNWNQITFLIDTLVEVGKLTKEEIIALMLVDIGNVKKGYLTRIELNHYVIIANQINFIERKYNQIGYLTNLLRKLDDIIFVKNELYFTEDAKQIFGENLEITTRKRNPYLHLIYKNQLKEESFSVYQIENCMVEKLPYPTLIASHIKPFIKCDENEAYDVNNGILLSRNIDSLFDLGYITFSDAGEIIFATKLKQEVKDFISNYSLDNRFINAKRLEYLDYHRNEVFEKRYIYA
ncbi:MAG: HNH endonuclease [Bacteroidetes bacterium]|nr:MAG: HNH endonuclease [Bacteroidota bacterium]